MTASLHRIRLVARVCRLLRCGALRSAEAEAIIVRMESARARVVAQMGEAS